MGSNAASSASENTFILVTGANTGLGLGICKRLIDDFIRLKPMEAHLTLIFTTRNAKKGDATLEIFRKRLRTFGSTFAAQRFVKRIHLVSLHVELTNLLSIRQLCRRLLESGIPKLDVVILNAGIGGWSGVNFPLAIWQVCTNMIRAVTWPRFKISRVGTLTDRQFPIEAEGDDIKEPPLGEVFCANVFGHYMLTHNLMPLLRSCGPQNPGRVIWTSTVDVGGQDFNPDDLQGLRSTAAYEHSKRITDLLALTAQDQPATAKSVASFIAARPTSNGGPADFEAFPSKPTFYLTQPGVCATTIMAINWFLWMSFLILMYIVRWCGSPWQTIGTYSGAASSVWLALAPPEDIQIKQAATGEGGGSVKWGSSCSRLGTNTVEKTEVEGWGLDGSGNPIHWWSKDFLGDWGRKLGAKDATKEDVETFVDEGRKVWMEMEELRIDWDRRLDEYEAKHAKKGQ